jgi:hypothetical protein
MHRRERSILLDDGDPSLGLYTPFTVGDDTPDFYEKTRLGMRVDEKVLLVVNSIIAALFLGILVL